ncbi:hypothetical protein EPN52_01725 [bacterium]|nr:MAG: hypothetical protein EPN52_01725 [bacterium]
MITGLVRLKPRLLAALLGVAVGGAMLAHGLLYALLGEDHDFGGAWHGTLLVAALCGLAWALADRRRNGLAALGAAAVPVLTGLQLPVFLVAEAAEGHLGGLGVWRLLLALLLLVAVAALAGLTLPAVARAISLSPQHLAAALGGCLRCGGVPLAAASAPLTSPHAPRAPPTRP